MVIYAITLAIALKKYPIYYNTILKYLPVLIAYTLVTEVLGLLIRDFDSFQIVFYSDQYSYANNSIFNIYGIIFFFYFYRIFYKILCTKKFKSWIKIGVIIFIITSLVNPFFQDFLIFQQVWATLIGSIVYILCISFYTIELKKNQQKENELLVWVSIGGLIFHLFYPFIAYAGNYDYEVYQEYNLRQFLFLLILTMYGCYIIGFLKLRKKPL